MLFDSQFVECFGYAGLALGDPLRVRLDAQQQADARLHAKEQRDGEYSEKERAHNDHGRPRPALERRHYDRGKQRYRQRLGQIASIAGVIEEAIHLFPRSGGDEYAGLGILVCGNV